MISTTDTANDLGGNAVVGVSFSLASPALTGNKTLYRLVIVSGKATVR